MVVNSNLKASLHKALGGRPDHAVLLELIREFKAKGGGQREAYDTLRETWMDSGYDEWEVTVDQRKDELEYVMEVVWGFCGYNPPLWDTSLSND